MFAKVFGQIFDSSIAEDYNCRRMFIDLLVLADSDGVVDMTHEAIARRTNVPIEEVEKYIAELQQPDEASRSKLEEGRRLIPIDSARGWGWQIVNYRHYRTIRDEEARRSYFRDQKRKQRKREKKQDVQDKMVDTGGRCQIAASPSSLEFVDKLKQNPAYKGIDIDREINKMQAWLLTPKARGRKLTKQFIVNWLNKVDAPISRSFRTTKIDPSKLEIASEFREWALGYYPRKTDEINSWKTWDQVPDFYRTEWKREKIDPMIEKSVGG